jgi:hypothetical protein
MCIIHDESIHYLYQNMIEAFKQSRIVPEKFIVNIAAHLCTCDQGSRLQRSNFAYSQFKFLPLSHSLIEFFVDSKNLFKTQDKLYNWFEKETQNSENQARASKLACFKAVVTDLRQNGRIDSGTKIEFLKLLKDASMRKYADLSAMPLRPRRAFLMKVIQLKFDLNLCSHKEFCDYLKTIDNSVIKYIEHINRFKAFIRDRNDLKIRNFLGACDVSIEVDDMRDLNGAITAVRQLGDSVLYRLSKKIPTDDMSKSLNDVIPSNYRKIQIQSPTTQTPDKKTKSIGKVVRSKNESNLGLKKLTDSSNDFFYANFDRILKNF